MKKVGIIKTKCSRCCDELELNRLGKYRYCRACHAQYMRLFRTRHSELSSLARKKANARAYANVYKRRGVLIQKPCQICGSEKSQMHHKDYDKPLEVTWLCRSCHLLLHEVRDL